MLEIWGSNSKFKFLLNFKKPFAVFLLKDQEAQGYNLELVSSE